MVPVSHRKELSLLLSEKLQLQGEISEVKSVGGGSINEAYSFDFGGHRYFLKKNNKTKFPKMFEKEVAGLLELAKCRLLIVPAVILNTVLEDEQYLVLEYLETKTETEAYFGELGKAIAAMHKIKAERFGFTESNFIGSLTQNNQQKSTWQEFFVTQRLEPLVRWCFDEKCFSQAVLRSFENLYEQINSIFPEEKPSLLHGDLWAGNKMNTSKGPSVFDPAVYYGHREMDLSMSKLFGGFHPVFYESYFAEYPPDKGFEKRTDICNLYPLLVHVKLFGQGYLHDVLATVRRF
jgi:fructosamine-3-kinase